LSRWRRRRDLWPDPDPVSPIEDAELVSMELDQLDEILEIEKESFLTPWTRGAFEYDLNENDLAHYWTLLKDGRVIGYSGIWLVGRIAHITTLCIHKKLRGLGLGRWLLLTTMKMGGEMGAERFTLEVRESNREAIALYESVGYRTVGRRPNYYQEIGEDALVMWTGEAPYEE